MKNVKAFTVKSGDYNLPGDYNLLLLRGKNNKCLTFGRWGGTKYCGSVSKQWNLRAFSEIKNCDKILIKDVNLLHLTFTRAYQYLSYLIDHRGQNSLSPFISLMDEYTSQNKTITSKDKVIFLTEHNMITLVLNDGNFIENNTKISSEVIEAFTFKKQDLKISLV